MTLSELKAFGEQFLASAKENLQRDGRPAPCALMVHAEGCDALPLHMLDKGDWPFAVHGLALTRPDYLAMFSVMEAWMKVGELGKLNPARPASSYEDRTEVIIIEGKDRASGTQTVLLQPIERDDAGKPIFTTGPEWWDEQQHAAWVSRLFSHI